jgi:hypothetical protein
MKRALIHIGPHKTGSTYIQKMMKTNAHLLAPSHQFLPKSDPLFEALQRITINIHTKQQLAEWLQAVYDTSLELARSLTAPNTLISSEDLLGPVPTTAGIAGLYPHLIHTLPAIQAGFDDGEVDTQFFAYIRTFHDWLRSVHSHKFRGRERPFAPRKFIKVNELPNTWDHFIADVQDSVGKDAFVYHSYEGDAVTGRLGSDMFHHFGIPDSVLDQMDWIEPVNVSRRSA